MKLLISIPFFVILFCSCQKRIDIDGAVKEKEQAKGNILVSYKKLNDIEAGPKKYIYYYEAEITNTAGSTTLIRDSVSFHVAGDNAWLPDDK